MELWNPASGFAKAIDLVELIPDMEAHKQNDGRGGLADRYPRPSAAIFHSDHLKQTIVPVVTIGKIEDHVSLFSEYEALFL